ncbi:MULTISPECIES: hypothetical protein [Pseudonocardia]|uniref:Uncharacterized protein n=2 Tax=Pseudonocardia TaxID=1847 RepID=A0A1Y2MZM1_PSEAH|nr:MULTISPECIES: hypothetical protein [Pseudonocardia]OSY40419.1 hypothetical protein BG845_02823 [Pseudonocardia autotrophica]TDN72252.1 hypothetical protein C8E95_1307 [Pseudonocardia autotrophica]BBG02962.1 hypothetical protein Pdca_41710 [Pseudonocardia autotrophica]GEC25137.1 hypothetical protein PSA01_21660 [Pseudonocardia saturnea]
MLAGSTALFGLLLGFRPFTVSLWLIAAVVAPVALRRAQSGRSAGQGTAVMALVLCGVAFPAMIVGSSSWSVTSGGAGALVVAPQPPREVGIAEWNAIVREPDSHVGERLVVHGTVVRADANTGTELVLLSAGPVPASFDDPTTLALRGDIVALRGDVIALSEGDTVHAEIEINGALAYDTMLGELLTVDADLLKLR